MIKMSRYLIGFFQSIVLLILMTACSKAKVSRPAIFLQSGSVYISCESGPYLLNLDSMANQCVSEEPIATLLSERSVFGCRMEEAMVMQANADIQLEKLESGYRVTALSNLTKLGLIDDDLNSDTLRVDLDQWFRVRRQSRRMDMYLTNQFVGGCIHDELIWRDFNP